MNAPTYPRGGRLLAAFMLACLLLTFSLPAAVAQDGTTEPPAAAPDAAAQPDAITTPLNSSLSSLSNRTGKFSFALTKGQ